MKRIVAAVMVLASAGLLNGCAYLTRASESALGVSPAGPSERPDLSHDGRYVAFDSPANGLVPGDDNDVNDVFVRDNLTATVTRVSVASDGSPGDGPSFTASISATGRYLAFESYASNLVLGDANGEVDVFWHDRDSDADGVFDEPGAIRTVAASANATTTGNGPSTSPTLTRAGTVVTFQSSATNIATNLTDTNGFTDIYIAQFDPATGDPFGPAIMSIKRNLGQQPVLANGHSRQGEIREDLHAITFATAATNLTSGPDMNGFEDVVVRTEEFPQFGEVTFALPALVTANGDSFAPRFVGNSTRVAYTSGATNLTPTATSAASTTSSSPTIHRSHPEPSVSAVHPQETKRTGRACSRARVTTAPASLSSRRRPTWCRWTRTGCRTSSCAPTPDVTQRASTTVLLEQADAASRTPAVSGDGVYIAFASEAQNLEVPDTNADADVFVRAAVVPEIDSVVVIDPNTGGELPPVLHPGSNELLVKGHGFGPVVSASLGRGVTSTTSTVQHHQVRLLVVVAPGTPAGSRNLVVANAGTGIGPVAGSARAFPVQIAAT